MNNLFLPIESAQSMRNLGFSDSCFGYYAKKGSKVYRYNKNPNSDASGREGYLCDAPLISQGIAFFDKKYLERELEYAKQIITVELEKRKK